MSGKSYRNELNSTAMIASVSKRFSEQLDSGDALSIEEFLLDEDVSLTDDVLSELIQLEVARCSLASRDVLATLGSQYIVRFPNNADAVRHVFEHLGVDPVQAPAGSTRPSNEPTTSGAVHDLAKTFSTNPRTGPSSEFRTLSEELLGQPEKVGRYTVLQKLGSGGQGIVYRAVHPTLPIEVAIKVSVQPLDERFHQSLKEEAVVLSELDHPGIARVRDFDIEDGHPFLVMDYVRGRSLSAILATGEVPLETVVMWLADVADAIDYSHRRGILHLDLKPENIVIGEHDQPKVIDFGLARVRGAWDVDIFEPDSISGTLGYMSPEQALGISQRIDARSDVFALGGILYRAITGNPPFRGEVVGKVLQAARNCEFDRQALIDSSAPREWIDICLKAMECDAKERFDSARQFAQAIRSVVDPPAVDRQNRRRKTATWGLASAAFLGVVGTWSLSGRDTTPPPGKATSALSSEASNALVIHAFRVIHRGRTAGDTQFQSDLFDERPTQVDDDLRIEVEFCEPAYALLFALNPDGAIQLCSPGLEQQPPERMKHLGFPRETDLAFGLTDGTGYQVFCLVASESPLPAFDKWREKLPPAPRDWTAGLSGNWVYLNGSVVPRSFRGVQEIRSRGDIRRIEHPKALVDYLDSLRAEEGVDAAAFVFEVKPTQL